MLFVSSGRRGTVSELIKNQGDSLIEAGVEIHYFVIKPGLRGYMSGIFSVRKLCNKEKYDLIHAHYSLSAFIASLAGNFPVVTSLLGSDVYKSKLARYITRLFYLFRWNKTIVKTSHMKIALRMDNAVIIPNGVNTERFIPISKEIARKKIGFPLSKKLIVFIADITRHEKNYALAFAAVKYLGGKNIELLPVNNVPNEMIPFFLNAADALLLTSKREGSVNVIKEAMACNVPIVATDVGDVKNNTKDLPGCFICDPTTGSLSKGILNALQVGPLTLSRERIFELKLDSDSVAKRIIDIYREVIYGEQ